jgi:hypothetical protein
MIFNFSPVVNVVCFAGRAPAVADTVTTAVCGRRGGGGDDIALCAGGKSLKRRKYLRAVVAMLFFGNPSLVSDDTCSVRGRAAAVMLTSTGRQVARGRRWSPRHWSVLRSTDAAVSPV